jgi:NADH:ubiquinone oxidoreductase subunit 6 (subunit J)
MLNVKVFAIYPFYLRFLPLLLLLTFFNSIFLIDLLNEGYILPVEYQNVENVDSFNNIDLFGQIFFGYFITIFLLSGFILLVAMLGSIILTLTLKSKRTSELSSRQLSRVGSIESFN